MISVQWFIVALEVVRDKLKRSMKIPKVMFEKYPYGTAGVELTWKRMGPGLGLGFGSFDIWIGWPRAQENLHYDGCGHKVVAA